MRTCRAGTAALRADCRGFTYVAVLAALVILGLFAQTATVVTSRVVRAEREAELLFRGLAYVRAIRSYYDAGGAAKMLPRNLDDLLVDPRHANRHHLREPYRDPFGEEWALVRGADGGIAGVASRSREAPLKRAHFPPGLEHFEAAESYADWAFVYEPRVLPQRTK